MGCTESKHISWLREIATDDTANTDDTTNTTNTNDIPTANNKWFKANDTEDGSDKQLRDYVLFIQKGGLDDAAKYIESRATAAEDAVKQGKTTKDKLIEVLDKANFYHEDIKNSYTYNNMKDSFNIAQYKAQVYQWIVKLLAAADDTTITSVCDEIKKVIDGDKNTLQEVMTTKKTSDVLKNVDVTNRKDTLKDDVDKLVNNLGDVIVECDNKISRLNTTESYGCKYGCGCDGDSDYARLYPILVAIFFTLFILLCVVFYIFIYKHDDNKIESYDYIPV